jgi:hypothetical protein
MGRSKGKPLAVQVAVQTQEGPSIPSTVQLVAMKHWSEIVSTKPQAEWTAADLTLAGKLANAMAAYDRVEAQSMVTPLIVESKTGPKSHPIFAMLAQQASTVLSLRRSVFRRDNPSGVIPLPPEDDNDGLI